MAQTTAAIQMTWRETELGRRMIAVAVAAAKLPIRWSDECGECPWCELDQALEDLAALTAAVIE